MIRNFEFQNPVNLVFGESRIEELGNFVPNDKKIFLTYGKGSIKKNGVYDKVIKALNNYKIVEFGGIEPNPTYETLIKAIELGRKEKIEFILAVGGGSVIDGTKFIAAGIPFENEPWDILSKKAEVKKTIPFGTILTLPATGSEMNAGAVISKKATKEKLVFGTPLCFPVFSILDVNVLSSLPKRQIANGIIDAFVHTTEQYMTYPVNAKIQDSFAEGILSTLIKDGPNFYNDPNDKESGANIMFSATMALNKLIGSGVPNDWSIHMIGHELTALHGIDHARTLAIILPALYNIMFDEKLDKLAQYAEKVWHISKGTKKHRAAEAINHTKMFFHNLEVETKLSAYIDELEPTVTEILNRFKKRQWNKLGEDGIVTPSKVEAILRACW